MKNFDVIIIGAGAAGLMCGLEAAKRGRKVCIIEHTRKVGEKIRISGGGRCNFTNLYCGPDNFLSQNPHFCKSALARYDQHDFVKMVEDHGIAYHEKSYSEKAGNENARGQLFCDDTATDIIDMLRFGFENHEGVFYMDTKIESLDSAAQGYEIKTSKGNFKCNHCVIASGGLSIPKIGASNFGYELAKRFDMNIIPPRAALVPLTFDDELLEKTQDLSGVSVDAQLSCGDGEFREGLLFTHRGLSGPSVLQVSSFWREDESITIDLAPDLKILDYLKKKRNTNPKQQISTVLSEILPSRMSNLIKDISGVDGRIADLSDDKLQSVSNILNSWKIKPKGSEGYRTAEVTLGGVDTNEVSSKTFEAKKAPGLFFIGEVLDVTGHLGGHNFQWAWSSGWCCGQVV